jgi:hypothetical protein
MNNQSRISGMEFKLCHSTAASPHLAVISHAVEVLGRRLEDVRL